MTVPLSTASQTEHPRIYVACLAAYNSGHLHGAWIEVTTPEEIMESVNKMLSMSPMATHAACEEFVLHDYEGFEGCHLSEYASFETVCALADFITEHGALGARLYRHFSNDLDEARAAFEAYAGEYLSAADFAAQMHEDCGTQIPQSLQYYIDWEALARDMALSGEITVFQTGINETHVFWSR